MIAPRRTVPGRAEGGAHTTKSKGQSSYLCERVKSLHRRTKPVSGIRQEIYNKETGQHDNGCNQRVFDGRCLLIPHTTTPASYPSCGLANSARLPPFHPSPVSRHCEPLVGFGIQASSPAVAPYPSLHTVPLIRPMEWIIQSVLMPAYISCQLCIPGAAGQYGLGVPASATPSWNEDVHEFALTPRYPCVVSRCRQNVSSDNISRTELVEWVSRHYARLPSLCRRTPSHHLPVLRRWNMCCLFGVPPHIAPLWGIYGNGSRSRCRAIDR